MTFWKIQFFPSYDDTQLPFAVSFLFRLQRSNQESIFRTHLSKEDCQRSVLYVLLNLSRDNFYVTLYSHLGSFLLFIVFHFFNYMAFYIKFQIKFLLIFILTITITDTVRDAYLRRIESHATQPCFYVQNYLSISSEHLEVYSVLLCFLFLRVVSTINRYSFIPYSLATGKIEWASIVLSKGLGGFFVRYEDQ